MTSSTSPSDGSEDISTDVNESGALWDNPEGNPVIPEDEGEGDYSSPWRRSSESLVRRQGINPSPSGILSYTQPLQYQVRKTGYYCVGKERPLSACD